MELSQIINQLQEAFNKQEVKEQVLEEDWLKWNFQTGIHSTGFCFASSGVIYRLTGGKENCDPEHWNQGTHYFLANKHTEDILDITSDQYIQRYIEIPYHLGKGRGLRMVSKKAKTLAKLAGLGELQ